MSVCRDAYNRLTVKLNNMKRSASRDSQSKTGVLGATARRASAVGRSYENIAGIPEISPDCSSPDRLRRRMGRSPHPFDGHKNDNYTRPSSLSDRSAYKVLCVSALHPKATDEYIKEAIYREYQSFGDFNIRISNDLDERVAYICFRTPNDARNAKHKKPRIALYDKIALVDPVYESSQRTELRSRRRSISPEFDRFLYARSSIAPGILAPRRSHIDHYDRYGPSQLHTLHGHHREYRGSLQHDYALPPRGPLLHRSHPHFHTSVSNQYVPLRYIGPRPHIFERTESKKEKFPNYLHHVQPEDDPLATRTLFAGNLEVNISDEELRRIFGKYGIVDDIDIKRPPPGTGNAFAFVRYQNLDMAHRAKLELSGQYIGKFQCKIGYGKVTPATRIWIGGLGVWTSATQLEREFDRFGAIKKIEYQKGDSFAHIQYETIEAASNAVKEMRGFPLGGSERRLRTDFAEIPGAALSSLKAKCSYEDTSLEFKRQEYDQHYEETLLSSHTSRAGYAQYSFRTGIRGRGGFRGRGRGLFHGSTQNEFHRNIHFPSSLAVNRPADIEQDWRHPPGESYETQKSLSQDKDVEALRSCSPLKRHISPNSDPDSLRPHGEINVAQSFIEIIRNSTITWQGALILKSSLFPAKFHFIDGDSDVIGNLMIDERGQHNLRITQRLRLDPPKLEDVQRRINSSSSHAIFLGLSSAISAVALGDNTVQTRPLRNLVSYLKQKEAAGVISLLNKLTEATGVLYAFPPCAFSMEILKRSGRNIIDEQLSEDHLVVVVVRGGAA